MLRLASGLPRSATSFAGRSRLYCQMQVAGRGVERLDLVGIVEDEQHAVMHDRRRLGGAGGQRPGPGDLQVLDVALVDLVERAVAPAVVGAPPHQPVRRRADCCSMASVTGVRLLAGSAAGCCAEAPDSHSSGNARIEVVNNALRTGCFDTIPSLGVARSMIEDVEMMLPARLRAFNGAHAGRVGKGARCGCCEGKALRAVPTIGRRPRGQKHAGDEINFCHVPGAFAHPTRLFTPRSENRDTPRLSAPPPAWRSPRA